MFLIERIIGIGIYTISLFFFSGYLMVQPKAKLSVVLKFYLFVIVVLAFFYYPDTTMDLFRLRIQIQGWMKYSVQEFLKIAFQTSTPGWYIYGYMLGKTGVQGLLPAVTAIIVYGNIFFVIRRSCDQFNVSNREAGKLIFCFMSIGSTFITTISNVRTMIGLSIVLVCVYQELVEGKSVFKNLWKYALASLMHQVVVTVVLIRVFFFFLEPVARKKNGAIKRGFQIIGMITMLLLSIPFAMELLQNVQSKAESYLSRETYSYVWEYVIGWINFAAILVSIFQTYLKRNGTQIVQVRNVCKLILITSVPMILFSYEYSIFRRYEIFVSMLWCVILAYNFSDYKNQLVIKFSGKFKVRYVDIMMAFGTIEWALSCVRGDLCGYKFFEL